MSRKQHPPGPTPPGNQPSAGPKANGGQPLNPDVPGGANFQDQDPKRRLGDFTGAGEHSIQQPSDLNDGTKHSR